MSSTATGRAVGVADALAELDGPLRGLGHLEAFRENEDRLGFRPDGRESLPDSPLDGDGRVELVQLVVQADKGPVERQGQGAGSRQARGAGTPGDGACAQEKSGGCAELQEAAP